MRNDSESPWDRVLGLMRIEDWFLGVGFAAVIVACFSLLLLDARGPARSVGQGILAVAIAVIVVCAIGWIVINLKEDRAVKSVGHTDVIALMDKQRWDDAIPKLEVLQASPDDETRIEAWSLLAQCYAATGRNADSEAMIRRSIDARGESNENLGQQLTCLGAVVRRQGRTDEAEEIYARALDILRKRDAEATVFTLRNVAYLYWFAGQRDRALQIYDEMPECDTDQLAFLTNVLKPFAEPPLPVEAA